MPSLDIILTIQAVLIWMIVLTATAPIPRLNNTWGWIIGIGAFVAWILEVGVFEHAGFLLTAAIAGYAMGCVLYNHSRKRIARREQRILSGK